MPQPNDSGAIGSHATISGGLASGGLKYGKQGRARDIAVLKELRECGPGPAVSTGTAR